MEGKKTTPQGMFSLFYHELMVFDLKRLQVLHFKGLHVVLTEDPKAEIHTLV